MSYLLDTCVVSDFIRSEPNTLLRVQRTSPASIMLSSITVMEIFYGLSLNPARAKKIKSIITSFVDEVTVLDFNQDDAEEAAILRASLKKQGSPIGSYDVLLAGTAINRHLVLVSANIKEFQRIKELSLENWRDSI